MNLVHFCTYSIPAALQVWRNLRNLTLCCEHEEYVYLQSVRVKNKEMLAVSCPQCSMIRLYDVQTGEGDKSLPQPEILYRMDESRRR